MKLSDLRVSWRQLLAEPAYSLVVVLGLAVAIAAGYLIAILLMDRWLPDPTVPAPDRVVRLEFKGNIPGRSDDWFDSSPYVFRDELLKDKAPVTQVTRVLDDELTLRAGERLSRVKIMFTDPDIEPMFGLKALQGDLKAALQKPDAIALTPVAAERLFGRTTDIVGQRVRMRGQDVTVTAVVPVQAGNSQLEFDAIANFDSPSNGLDDRAKKAWYTVSGRVFARLADGATPAQMSTLLQDMFDRSPGTRESPPEWSANGRKAGFMRATSLSRLPFDGARQSTSLMLYGALTAVAAAMLTLACINYVNLSSVRTLRRQREIAIRKSLGASPMRLAGQFITESTLVALLAGVLGLLLAWMLAPAMSDLLDAHFTAKLLAPLQLAALALGCVVLGCLTGLYPARVALGVHCAPALQGRKQSEGSRGRQLRRAMTVLQFGAALTLSGAAVIVVWQSNYIAGLDMGFQTANRLAVNLPEDLKPDQYRSLFDALKASPAVQSIGASRDVPGSNSVGMVDGLSNGATKVQARMSAVDLDFLKTYQVPILAGTLDGLQLPEARPAPDAPPLQDRPIVLDSTAATALGFATSQDAIGASLKRGRNSERTVRVVAVVGAIKQEGARNIQQPQAFVPARYGMAVLTLQGKDMAAMRAAVNDIWPRYVPDEVVDMIGVDEQLSQRYRLDRNTGLLIAGTSLIALLLAGFGVYALAAYTVQRAALEIVIRKLHGAGHRHIAQLLIKEFLPLMGLAALVSLPLIWWLGQQYLAGFVERANMGGWPLLAALMGTLLMAGLAGLRHGLAAMAMRPILALRD